MAVVKADVYGHGDCQVAKVFADCGVNDFVVSNIKEAIDLRNAGINGQILILGYTPISEYSDLLRYDITQAITCEEYAKVLCPGVKVQFAIDAGMNRIGIPTFYQ